ncbi:methyltransferase domain-containing protein [Nocardioides mangrovicus]|uniref:Methyltransferase domain-containing protein n=1 Tax=Nocardioides mangrovicus TaxID=2478913 RepID=A0A3L8P3H7_9ACTN|nr:class I SAM-dependent methyltransferase [Nocardioides mangrovicus]RLV49079.1 methyltransferase domain-containing protein [Nocardioides mangrovicus]
MNRCSPGALFAAALRGHDVELLEEAAPSRPLAAWRWMHATASDQVVLEACEGTTLDVGCGPGRMAAELTGRGVPALGIDVVPEAVAQTRARGATALERDVFDPVPGSWRTVLLADGNIGIGGDPVRLLGRAADLLEPGGKVVADLAAAGLASGVRTHWLSGRGMVSTPFTWAVVGPGEIALLAHRVGLSLERIERSGDRCFAVLRKSDDGAASTA